jgi:hypothetical protein
MAYGLPLSGTRFALLERLRNFAASKEEWLRSAAYCLPHDFVTKLTSGSLFEPAKKRKRGVHTGIKGNSLSSQRIQSQFGGEVEHVMYQSKKGIDRVQSTLQDSDRQANSSWVSNFAVSY